MLYTLFYTLQGKQASYTGTIKEIGLFMSSSAFYMFAYVDEMLPATEKELLKYNQKN